jgi:hypothetical protein
MQTDAPIFSPVFGQFVGPSKKSVLFHKSSLSLFFLCSHLIFLVPSQDRTLLNRTVLLPSQSPGVGKKK